MKFTPVKTFYEKVFMLEIANKAMGRMSTMPLNCKSDFKLFLSLLW